MISCVILYSSEQPISLSSPPERSARHVVCSLTEAVIGSRRPPDPRPPKVWSLLLRGVASRTKVAIARDKRAIDRVHDCGGVDSSLV